MKAFGLWTDGDYMTLGAGSGTQVLAFKSRDLVRTWLGGWARLVRTGTYILSLQQEHRVPCEHQRTLRSQANGRSWDVNEKCLWVLVCLFRGLWKWRTLKLSLKGLASGWRRWAPGGLPRRGSSGCRKATFDQAA